MLLTVVLSPHVHRRDSLGRPSTFQGIILDVTEHDWDEMIAVADYIVFLAATTGLAEANRCATASARLERYNSLEEMLSDI